MMKNESKIDREKIVHKRKRSKKMKKIQKMK